MDNVGNIGIYNPAKKISEEIIFPNIKRHSDAMTLAFDGIYRFGETVDMPKSPNERIERMFTGLQLMISCQFIIIYDAIGNVKINDTDSWTSKNKSKDEESTIPFEDEDNNFNDLCDILEFLKKCDYDIIDAKKTRTLADDFIWEKQDNYGKTVKELTPRFFTMRDNLCRSYVEVHEILLREEILAGRNGQDEDVKEREKELEAIRRITSS